MNNYFCKYKDLYLFLGLIAIYLIWSFYDFFQSARAGLDPSWILGLNWGKTINVQWGKEFLFTYGPLYYFSGIIVPDFYSSKMYLLIEVCLNLFYSLIKAGTVFLFYRRANSTYKMYAAIFSGVVMLLCSQGSPELIVFFAAMLLCDGFYELYENDTVISKKIIVNNIIASLLMVIAQYTKFSFFNIAVVLLILLSILYISRRKYKIAVTLAGSYIFFSSLLWIISGQRINNLFGYIYTGLQFSNGYTPAMNYHFVDLTTFNIFVLSFITIGFFVIILIYFLNKKKYLHFFLCFFISPQIFLLFKESFVRADSGHVYIFMKVIPIITLYLLFVSLLYSQPLKQQNNLFVINSSYYSLISAIIVTCISMNILNIRILPENHAYQIIEYYKDFNNNIIKTKEYIQKSYNNFNDLLENINTEDKIDIFPWDISLLYAYNLNWQPRPVIQSYTNYTQILDSLTARHFISEKAPDKLIFTPMTIDGRYALFDEPETFRTVLLNYSITMVNSSYLILEKNKNIYPVKMDEIKTITAKTGEIIEVPFYEDAYVFMEVAYDFNFLGKLVNFFFKTNIFKNNNLNIEIYLTDESKAKYRFIHKTAKNGLFVSKHVSNIQELTQVFEKDFTPNIKGVCILNRNIFYNKNINVKFKKTEFNKKIPVLNDMVPIVNIPIPKDINGIEVNDISSINKSNDNIILYCGTNDPYICFPLKEPINKPSYYALEIEYSNSKAGAIQFFYDFGNGYSEINSFRTKLEISSKKSKLCVPILYWAGKKKLFSVRIDPPDGTKFELENIWIYGNN